MTQTPDLNIQVELITPEVADQYLKHNVHNRKIRQRTVTAYAEDMREGRWELNGQGIAFDVFGNLSDGQHRMLAVIESGVTVPMVVIRGVSRAAQDTMDTGVSRRFSDVLALHGETDSAMLAAAVRSVFLWQRGTRLFGGGGSAAATSQQLLNCLEENKWIRDEIPLIRRLSAHVKLPATVSGALIFAFNEIESTDAEFFFDRLTSDEGHHLGEPIYALRKVLLASTGVRGARNVKYLAALTCKAWNKYRLGESCQQLSFRIGGANPELFPEPK